MHNDNRILCYYFKRTLACSGELLKQIYHSAVGFGMVADAGERVTSMRGHVEKPCPLPSSIPEPKTALNTTVKYNQRELEV